MGEFEKKKKIAFWLGFLSGYLRVVFLVGAVLWLAALLCGGRFANDYQAPLGTEWTPPYCAPGVRTGGAECREGWKR